MAVTEWFSNLWLKTVKPSEDRGMKDVLEASENFRQQK